MVRFSCCTLLAFLALVVVLPAQDDKPKAKSGKPEKAAAAPKDDALTAKDPVITALDEFSKSKVSKKAAEWKSTLPAPPKQAFDGSRDYFWHVETDKGSFTIRLLAQVAPMHVTNTIYLSRAGFYDGLTFPRIIPGFMAQGGSPTNTQAGNAGYQFDGEFDAAVKHEGAGILSAAHSGPGTDSSQFFVTFASASHLDGKHTVYGAVTEGLESLKAIEACGSEGGKPKATVTITRTWITVAKGTDKPKAPPKKSSGK